MKTSTPTASRPTSQSTQQLPPRQLSIPPESQSPSPQQQQSQPVQPWSVHRLNLLPPTTSKRSDPPPPPFPRYGHSLSATASAAGELFLFGGVAHNSLRNDLYVLLTDDLSATILETTGEVPSPRSGHTCSRIGNSLLIWGGGTNTDEQGKFSGPYDDSIYLLNLETREWTRVVAIGPGPVGRYYHAATMVGSKLFVFGGKNHKELLNDMWAFDLNSLNSVWDSYEPAPGGEKPSPRTGHVLVNTGDRIILFGGADSRYHYNDTWLFNVSTRKWTELQCTGCIPSPRAGHAAALVDDVMYIFGGRVDEASVDDLFAFRLSTQRWFKYQNIGPSPSKRWLHAMASDGTRVFVLGGKLSEIARGDETAFIHVLDTKHTKYSNPDPNAVEPEKTTQSAWNSSTSPPAQDQPQHPTYSSSDTYAAHSAPPFQKVTPEELPLGRATFLQITPEQIPSLNGLPRCVPEEGDDYDGEVSAERAKFTLPDTSFEGEAAQLELERHLSATPATLTERDQRLVQPLNELREHTDRLLARTSQVEQKDAELMEMRAKLDELLLSRRSHDQQVRSLEQALQKATSHVVDADERCQRAREQIGKYETELAEVRAELRAKKSELETVRSRLMDAEIGWAKSKTEADTLRALTTAGLVSSDEDRITHGLVERIRAMEAEMASLRLSEKALEGIQSRNEG